MIQRTLSLFSLWTAAILTLELAGFTESAHLQTLPLSSLSLVQVSQAKIVTLTLQNSLKPTGLLLSGGKGDKSGIKAIWSIK
ncbi:hypothetical protein J0895_23600 [Phormidium pseudopriestleyi FRX01]|uniref:Uncharacterized protein n=1 Tax=Phormidium pseudopriestleyi FRX01 TaxID=1759528 RepID=A0ABS3FY27_9CYAN|nr:hypothetical protein [Phormidium pseudopriestleyi]MBO0352011.1 hypothetical protein [Phormidium pseudopriestleyi FRX01]